MKFVLNIIDSRMFITWDRNNIRMLQCGLIRVCRCTGVTWITLYRYLNRQLKNKMSLVKWRCRLVSKL